MMTRRRARVVVIAAAAAAFACVAPAQQRKPNVVILATGGTIAGAGATGTQSAYKSGAVGIDTRPRVGPGFRLQWEPAQNCHVLLYPEGMVKLNGSAGEIMKRCDGQASLSEIVADLETAFAAQGLQGDVTAFVEMAGKQRWLVWD